MEAQVFQQHDIARLEFSRSAGGLDFRAHAVVQKTNRFREQLGEFVGDGLERELFDPLSVRASEVRHQDHGRALIEGEADRGKGGDDALVVGDGTGGFVLRNIEINADENAFA
jgi:hypothetical protein